MKKSLRIAGALLAALLFFSLSSLKAQVKIGGNPAVVDPYSILELESLRKGLLLPRVDANGFQSLVTAGNTVKNGLLIYLNQTSGIYEPGFYIRQDDKWERIGVGGAMTKFWKTDGNTVTGGEWFGTFNAAPLQIKTANTDRMNIAADGAFIFTGSSYKFSSGIGAAGVTDNDVLVIGADGTLLKKTFNNITVKSLESLTGDLDLAIDAATTHTAADFAGAGQTVTLNLPRMTDAATQPYGFIEAADYLKLQAITANDAFAIGMPVNSDALGATGGQFALNAGKWELQLNNAGPNRAGLVTSTGTQIFGGNKTFNGNVAIGSATTGLTVNGEITIPTLAAVDAAEVSYNMLLRNATNQVRQVLVPKWKMDAEGISGITVEGATPANVTGTAADGRLSFEQVGTGTDFTIKAAGANKIVFEMPSASETSRGLITADAQTVGGKKTFTSEVTAGNGTGTAININGGITVRHRELFSGGQVEPSDYVLLVKGSGNETDISVSLAAPNTVSGRVYVFTRLPHASPMSHESASIVQITSTSGTVAEISEPYTTVTVMSDGTQWIVMSRSMGGL